MEFPDFSGPQASDERAAIGREWLVTNGAGGYAMGTLAFARTRRYHGLLIAATRPPAGRTLLAAGCLQTVRLENGDTFDLDGELSPNGELSRDPLIFLRRFSISDGVPTWRFETPGGALSRRVFMTRGEETTWLTFTLEAGRLELRSNAPDGNAGAAPSLPLTPDPVTITLAPLVAGRDHHGLQLAGEPPRVLGAADGLVVTFPGCPSLHVRANAGEVATDGGWRRCGYLAVEQERGAPDPLEDLYQAGSITARLRVGETLAVAFTTNPDVHGLTWPRELSAVREHSRRILQFANLEREPEWVNALVLAADQFIVKRGDGETVIAGYPWFTDWGRDTMIALPGLSLAVGRPELAASLIRTFLAHESQGMIPNRFPDAGEEPEYNTVDATLWLFEALRQYVAATADDALVDEAWGALERIIVAHLRGARYGIRAEADGLLRQGDGGTQLTWMDVRIGAEAITPRSGKPVEVNALWYSALRTMSEFAATREASLDYAALAERARAGFRRYWNAATGYPFDTLDGEDGNDASLRPNAVIAASLQHSPFTRAERRLIVDVAGQELLTARGLRSLSPSDPRYRPLYLGDLDARDRAYHQGVVWGWLIGPYAEAHYRAYGQPNAALDLLRPMADHLLEAGLGSVSEIFDGDAPHAPRGCPWQAWSVAEVLRVYRLLRAAGAKNNVG